MIEIKRELFYGLKKHLGMNLKYTQHQQKAIDRCEGNLQTIVMLVKKKQKIMKENTTYISLSYLIRKLLAVKPSMMLLQSFDI